MVEMKYIAYFFAVFDSIFHMVLVFGWVGLTEIFKREGFFEFLCNDEALESGKLGF